MASTESTVNTESTRQGMETTNINSSRKTQLIDFHTHILPGVDDGAKTVAESLKMISDLQQQGCGAIVLSPHYYSDEISLSDFVKRRNAACRELESALSGSHPDMFLAAEVYYSDYLLNNDTLEALTIGNSNCILLEMPYSCRFSEHSVRQIQRLMSEFGVRCVLAHIERYPVLLKNTRLLDDLLDIGCIAQINVSSLEHFLYRKKLLSLIETGRVTLLGSDCHNLTDRTASFQAGLQIIEKKLGSRAIEKLNQNAASILY